MPKFEDAGTTLEVAVNDVRALVRPDGADFEIVSVDEEAGHVHLKLVLEGANCEECVMPVDLLQQIARDVMSRQMPSIRSVTIDDPRVNS
jgi:Fe-S cluster biogenesis protein NfuA